jgi:hypothetical protein
VQSIWGEGERHCRSLQRLHRRVLKDTNVRQLLDRLEDEGEVELRHVYEAALVARQHAERRPPIPKFDVDDDDEAA